MEFLKAIFSFITDNKWFIFSIIFIAIFKTPISDFLKRITNIVFKSSQKGIEFSASQIDKNVEEEVQSELNDYNPFDNPKKDEVPEEESTKKTYWISEILDKLDQGDIESARVAFKKHQIDEQDTDKLYHDEAMFSAMLYRKGNDNDSLLRLEELVNNQTDEDKRCQPFFG